MNPSMSERIERITTAYHAELPKTASKVYDSTELPRCYEAITPEWLTATLFAQSNSVTVRGCEIEPHVASPAAADRRRVCIQYDDVGRQQSLPRTLFCKATFDLRSRILLGASGVARSEANFYNYIRPHLDIEAPTSLFARFDPVSFKSILVLPDMIDNGTEFCNERTMITRERVEGQLALLAEIHGKCYGDPRVRSQLPSLPTWPEFFDTMSLVGIERNSIRGFLAAKDVIPGRIYRRSNSIWPTVVLSVERHTQLPQTMIHGDVHLKNWYISRHGKMGLCDWQTASRGHWSRDVAHLLVTVLSVEDRRAWEAGLLRFYLDRLRAAGGPRVRFAQAWELYRQQVMSVLAWWSLALTGEPGFPDVEQENPTLQFVRRAAIAADDLDSIQI